LKFQAGIDACASANHIKSLNYAAPFLLLMDAFFFLPGMGNEFLSNPRVQMIFSFLPFGSLVGAFGWFTKYGGLKSDDPDFPEARQAVKKALILWIILSAVHAAVLAKIFL
jgi:hypothetical protein